MSAELKLGRLPTGICPAVQDSLSCLLAIPCCGSHSCSFPCLQPVVGQNCAWSGMPTCQCESNYCGVIGNCPAGPCSNYGGSDCICLEGDICSNGGIQMFGLTGNGYLVLGLAGCVGTPSLSLSFLSSTSGDPFCSGPNLDVTWSVGRIPVDGAQAVNGATLTGLFPPEDAGGLIFNNLHQECSLSVSVAFCCASDDADGID